VEFLAANPDQWLLLIGPFFVFTVVSGPMRGPRCWAGISLQHSPPDCDRG